MDVKKYVRLVQRVQDSGSFRTRTKVNKNVYKKVKDALIDTESTAEASEAVQSIMEEGDSPEEVIAATVEVLGEVIDVLQNSVDGENLDDDDFEDDDEISDSRRKFKLKSQKKKLRK